jgi:hypothetical protein
MEDGVNLRIFINHIKADNVSLVKKKYSQSVGVLSTAVGKVLKHSKSTEIYTVSLYI